LASGNPNPQVEHLTKVLLSLAERYQVAKLSTGDNWLQNVFALGVILALAVFIAYVVVVLVWSSRFKIGRV
jgi:flagellar biogenesis protein FliO